MKRVESNLPKSAAAARQLPRFQRAAVYARQLTVVLVGLLTAALLLMIAAWWLRHVEAEPIWRAALLNVSAALLIFVAGLESARRVSLWRCKDVTGAGSAVPPHSPPSADKGKWEERVRRWVERLREKLLQHLRSEEFLIASLALLTLWLARSTWHLPLAGASLALPGYAGAGVALCGAFALLVFERYLSSRSAAEWPESIELAHLARATLLTLVLDAIALIYDSDARTWPSRLAIVAGIVPGALALELLSRAIYAALTRPVREDSEPPLLADTFIARLFTWPPRPLKNLQEELRDRFGIDLRQNWAFDFIRRASLPVLAVVLVIGWLLTGVKELPIASRGIYERFGKPVGVWDPGLHWGLPWPLARTLRVENGVVHELAATVPSDTSAEPDRSTADDPAPASANRLWDVSHVAENAQVISSEADAKQSFQIVNMDVRFIYRIGLSPAAIMAATYHCADIEALIRSTASRVMVHYFASRTLGGLLGEHRDVLARDIGRTVQEDLNHFDSGIELLSVLIESIHPPAGAAAAYHSVQAAQISAQAIVAEERGTAASTVNKAEQEATRLLDSATAAAREHTASAEIARLGFDAEQESFRDAGQAFVRERYFTQLAEGLSKANLVIIDHRIGGAGGAPTIDLRNFSGSSYSYGSP